MGADCELTEIVAARNLALSLCWSGGMIVKVDLHWAEAVSETPNPSSQAIELRAALERYEVRKPPQWPDLPLDFSSLSDFQRAALDELKRIPSGATLTYGELAERLGRPGGAQAVGRAMGANPFPLIYPCHRVVGSGGNMTGFSAEGGVEMKVYLLRLEGAVQNVLPGLE